MEYLLQLTDPFFTLSKMEIKFTVTHYGSATSTYVLPPFASNTIRGKFSNIRMNADDKSVGGQTKFSKIQSDKIFISTFI